MTGWQTLQNLANHHGRHLSPTYIVWLVKQQGVSACNQMRDESYKFLLQPVILAKHFLPPMMVNILLGSVLWTTYSEATDRLGPYVHSPMLLTALSGALAGSAQALAAAPAENARFILEGTSVSTGWSDAWQEVFRGRVDATYTSSKDRTREARQVRDWMREVGDMAGRGWNGWKWGIAKDCCGTRPLPYRCHLLILYAGFSVFFSIFELTRRAATEAKATTRTLLRRHSSSLGMDDKLSRVTLRVVHAATLVSGGAIAGLAYEFCCRPWDVARKAVHVAAVVSPERHSVTSILLLKAKDEGWTSFIKAPPLHISDTSSSPIQRRLRAVTRTLARVGPWGMGFLVWETFGPGFP